ncbi:MAG: tetratricopeptide repeat protein [Candidatus Lokiarchaeota archaeon]|nr:tetratricopeptide repeat protein [Candidatus Lokiarchaeota archaeon]
MKYPENTGDLIQKAGILSNIAINYHRAGGTDQALPFYEEAIKLNDKMGNKLNNRILFTNLGLLFKSENNYDKAIENLKNAIKIDEIMMDIEHIAFIKEELADIYIMKKYIK